MPKVRHFGNELKEKILLDKFGNLANFFLERAMEEIEIMSWLTLDAIKKKAKIEETIGNLQTDHSMSVFCTIEEDYLELYYSDSEANYLRRYEDREEFELAMEQRKEEDGEASFEEEPRDYDEDEEEEDEFDSIEDESDQY